MARPRAPFLVPLLLLLTGCGGADLVETPGGSTVTVSPQVVTLLPGESSAFSALVTGTKNQSVTWSVVGGSSNGAFTGVTGVYTAPLLPGTYAVVATSAENVAKAGSATAVVIQPAIVTVSPPHISLAPGDSQMFSASISGAGSQAVTWSVKGGDGNGTFTGTSGLYTAPAALSGTFTVIATAVSDKTRVGTATVTVNGPVNVTVSPSLVSLLPGGVQKFTATVTGISPETVDWSVTGANAGTIDSTGSYTAPMNAGNFTIKATARANGTSVGTAVVKVSPVGLTLSPEQVTLDQGASQLFQPSLTGTTNPSIAWYVNETKIKDQSGPYLYIASSGAGDFILKGVPAADPTVFATATIHVNAVMVSGLTPVTAVVATKGTVAFIATVTGSTNKGTTWSVLTGGAGGSINDFGVYTASTVVGTDTVVATSTADPTASRIALVTVGNVSVSPPFNSAQQAGIGHISFSATVTGVTDTGVTWEILPAANGGTITNVGYFTAPTAPGIYRVRATSVVNAALFGEVPVTVF